MAKTEKRNVHKRTIVTKVAESTGNNQEYTRKVVDEFLSQIVSELANGNRLEFRGFGVFEPVMRKKKHARNPKTQEEVNCSPPIPLLGSEWERRCGNR